MKKMFTVETIAYNGILAAVYAVVTVICGPLSYSFMQFRFSELLNLLVFFNPSYTLGLTIGCLLANLFSTAGPIDILLGTLSTLVSCLLMIGYSKFMKNLFSTGLIPCIINALVVPFTIYISLLGTSEAMILNASTYFMMFGWVFLGESVCILGIGYPLFLLLSKKNKNFYKRILASRNMDYKW